MYAKGMTTGAIETHIRDIYGVDISDTTVSRITDNILPIAKKALMADLKVVYAAEDEVSVVDEASAVDR
ncbi:MAG: transposase [Clostridia bacterium]